MPLSTQEVSNWSDKKWLSFHGFHSTILKKTNTNERKNYDDRWQQRYDDDDDENNDYLTIFNKKHSHVSLNVH